MHFSVLSVLLFHSFCLIAIAAPHHPIQKIQHEHKLLSIIYEPSQAFTPAVLSSAQKNNQQFLMAKVNGKNKYDISLNFFNNQWQGILIDDGKIYQIMQNEQAELITQLLQIEEQNTPLVQDEIIKRPNNQPQFLTHNSYTKAQPERTLRTDIVVDQQHFELYGQNVSSDRLMSMINNAALIYQQQTNLQILVESITYYNQDNDPFSNNTSKKDRPFVGKNLQKLQHFAIIFFSLICYATH